LIKKYFKDYFGFYILLFVVVFTIFAMYAFQSNKEKKYYSDLINYVKVGQVKELSVTGHRAEVLLNDNQRMLISVPDINVMYQDIGPEIRDQVKNGTLKFDTPQQSNSPFWLSTFSSLAIIILTIVGFSIFMQQTHGGAGGRGMSFGKSRAKMNMDEMTNVKFADVAGADEEKEELKELVEFLKTPDKFLALGARIPRGVLLVGPPGTGKTLLAKAVAGEAGVPFFSISGSDFVEMFVGVGASRVRDLFEQAKKFSPAIIFIDEIDAVGRHRGAGLGGGHDEREQTLNQLLVEMDGFGSNKGIIVIAATNRPDILDPALLRPGRFDRQVMVGLPDIKGREEILKVHTRGKKLDLDVDLVTLAKTTAGFSGADLENLCNEAAILAARRNKTLIGKVEFSESIIKVIAGPEKKTRVMTEREKKLVAYHEAGHAIATKMLPGQDPVHQVSIIPRGMAGGFTMSLPTEDRRYISKTHMLNEITVCLGGRIAERLVIGDISTGASSDIEQATKISRNMIMKYGMSDELGPVSFASDSDEIFIGKDMAHSKNYSESIANKIDSEVKNVISECYSRCEKILTENMSYLHKVANQLIEKEVLNSEEFEEIFKN